MDCRDFLPVELQNNFSEELFFKNKLLNINLPTKIIALNIKLLRDIADNNPEACQLLAYIYIHGAFGFSSDKYQATHYIYTGARLKSPHCQYMMGLFLQNKIQFTKQTTTTTTATNNEFEDDSFDLDIDLDLDVLDDLDDKLNFDVINPLEAKSANYWFRLAASQGLEAARIELIKTS